MSRNRAGLLMLLWSLTAAAEGPERRIELGLPLDGVVQEVVVEAGQQVRQGAVLLRLDPRRYQFRLNHAEALLDASRVELEDVELELKNQIELFERMVTTESELKRARRAAARVRAEIAQHQAMRDEAALELEWTVLKAPLDGVVVERFAEPGEVISSHHPATLLLLKVSR
jgi:RND family efflux transporter MFP subunit